MERERGREKDWEDGDSEEKGGCGVREIPKEGMWGESQRVRWAKGEIVPTAR